MQTFRKYERLFQKKSIDEVFINGSVFYTYPFKITWMIVKETQGNPARILISVPKRNFKKAVVRNRIRRLIKEVYRKHKSSLYQHLLSHNTEINFALIYTAKEVLNYRELEEKIILLISRLIKEHEKVTG